jgi:MFS family permease
MNPTEQIQDPRKEILDGKMSVVQIVVVCLCSLINIFDGFDVLAVSYTASSLSQEWQMRPDQMGTLLSAGLFGMAVGALTISLLADARGRRFTILVCLALIAVGMLGAAWAHAYLPFALWRVLSGLGIGGMISCTGTLVFEFTSLRRRELGLGMVAVGFPIGAAFGATVAAGLMDLYGWRSVYLAGALASVALLIVCVWLLPESLDFMIQRRPPGAVARVNAILARIGVPVIAALPLPGGSHASRIRDLFHSPLLGRLLPICLSYFFFMFSFYFMLSWFPKMLIDSGYDRATALSMAFLLNLAGIVGALSIGGISGRSSLQKVSMAVLLLLAIAIGLFGLVARGSLLQIRVLIVPMGFLMYAAMVVCYSTMASTFPAAVRVSGVGLTLSAGRLGSVLGPYLAGTLFTIGMARPLVCLLLGLPCAVAAGFIAVVHLTRRPGRFNQATHSPR